LCIKFVSIKELYYDARSTKSQDLFENLAFGKRTICLNIMKLFHRPKPKDKASNKMHIDDLIRGL